MATILVAQDGDLIVLPWGWARLGNNELHLVSTKKDPPLVVQGSIAGISIGGFAFGRLRNDGSGKIDQMVLVQGKQNELTRNNPSSLAGEFTVHVHDGKVHLNPDGSVNNDMSMRKIIEGRHDGVWLKGISAGEGLPPGPPDNPSGPVVELPPLVGGDDYPPGAFGIPIGDFTALEAFYGFESEDHQHYADGDMPWVAPNTKGNFSVLWEMEKRKASDAPT
jgi:hypothetical protein